MSTLSTFASITSPYSAAESWAYDKIVGPVLCGFFEEFQDDLLDGIPHGGTVADVGCGGGHIALLIAQRRGDAVVHGLDLSEEQIERANQRAVRELGDERARFVVGDAARLPWEDGSVDVLVSIGSIKHWPDRLAGLRECMRVLADGGRFFITETDRGCRFEDMNRFVSRIPLPGPLRFTFRLFYRTYVAGQSLDLAEARDLFDQLGEATGEVVRTDNGGLLFRGKRVQRGAAEA
ncbi:MAG: class I SAM-dependent methyltransferase [Myxococcota bacterium]